MRLLVSAFFGVALILGAGVALAAMSGGPVLSTPGAMHWVAGTGAAKGSWAATLVGDPNKSGTAIIRVKMPNGYANQPHYHATAEYITVMQGTLLFGTGDTIDKSKATALPVGSFIMVPKGVHHWSVAQGETIEQVDGEGPLTNLPIKHSM